MAAAGTVAATHAASHRSGLRSGDGLGWAGLGWAGLGCPGLYSGYRYDLPLVPGVFLHLAIYELKLINIIVFCLLIKDRNIHLLFVN